MQNGSINFDHPSMNFRPTHPPMHRLPPRNPHHPPICTTYGPPQDPLFHQTPNPSIDHDNQLPQPYNHGVSDYEQNLREEVIFLHSLWHRGPRLSNPLQNPHLKHTHSTSFKKKNKKKKPDKTHHLQIVVSDKEWPVDPKPISASLGWGEFKAREAPNARPATAEERESIFSLKVQLKGLDSCVGLFENDDDDDEDDDEFDEEEAFEYFLKVFEEDEELRGFHVKKWGNGEFYCLVCGVVGKKLRRKYKNCVALVQHSVSIAKTKKRKAHRAYGRVICKVLGWDFDRLPSVPSIAGDDSGLCSGKPSEIQDVKAWGT